MISKFWNGKMLGLFGAGILILNSLVRKIINFFYSKVHVNNLCSENDVIIRSGFKCMYPKNIILQKGVFINSNVNISSEICKSKLVVCENVSLSTNCKIDYTGSLVIGKNSLLSENVSIQTHDHGINPRSEPIPKSLKIGENVWIGMNALILSNVREIGDNSIIGAGSVVTKPVPSNCIVAGNPATIIRYLNGSSID
ncbi:MAG: acyltransferase [Bacteroidales bacterium]|nr:acyltransferase [Bacteroidales bacterium]